MLDLIEKEDTKNLDAFMEDQIAAKAAITTDKWTGYKPLKKNFQNLPQIYSGKKGKNFPDLHRAIINLKARFRGVHHHVNDLQDYLDECCYRFNRSFIKENIFDNLLNRMINTKPCLIKNIST